MNSVFLNRLADERRVNDWCYSASPVVGVVVGLYDCGVNVVLDQPVEIGITADSDALHLLLGDVGAVCIEVAKDHDVL